MLPAHSASSDAFLGAAPRRLVSPLFLTYTQIAAVLCPFVWIFVSGCQGKLSETKVSQSSGVVGSNEVGVASKGEKDAPGSRTQRLEGHSLEVLQSKQLAAKVVCDKPLRSVWNDLRWISAKFALDPDRHFAITPSVDVVIEEMLVELGTVVRSDTPIFKLSAPEITQVRGKWTTGQSKLRIARQKLEWQQEIQKTVSDLSKQIATANATTSIQQFSQQRLGSHGGKILEAMVRWSAAKRMLESSQGVAEGALSNRVMIERESEFAGAKAVLESTIQQVTFDIAQETLNSQMAVDEAIAELESTESELHHMQGSAPRKGSSEAMRVFDTEDPTDPDAFVFRTPRGGTLLERFFARGERAQKGETLAVVADLSELWVVGELRTQDWDLIAYRPGNKVKVIVPGLETLGTLDASLVYIGGNVDPTTQSIRLAASVANPTGSLRPGMYARMSITSELGEVSTIVPASAIFTNMGVDYILQQEDPVHFVLSKVKIGRRNDQQVEILGGIDPEKRIMTQGVFAIASEIFIEEE